MTKELFLRLQTYEKKTKTLRNTQKAMMTTRIIFVATGP
jgi:hypothetical protein